MLNYIICKISYVGNKMLVFENNWKGYTGIIAKPDGFEVNKTKRIYVHVVNKLDNKNHINSEMYCFNTLEQKLFFVNLLNVPGIGPKTAINIMVNDLNTLVSLIQNKQENELDKLSGITPKIAHDLVEKLSNAKFYLQTNKPNSNLTNKTSFTLEDLAETLMRMGYSKTDIEYSLSQINYEEMAQKEIDDVLTSCIQNIMNKNNPELNN